MPATAVDAVDLNVIVFFSVFGAVSKVSGCGWQASKKQNAAYPVPDVIAIRDRRTSKVRCGARRDRHDYVENR